MTVLQSQAEAAGFTISHAIGRAVALLDPAGGVTINVNLYDADDNDATKTGLPVARLEYKANTVTPARGYPGRINFVDGSKNKCMCGFGMPTHDNGQTTKLCTHAVAALIVADGGNALPIPEKQAGERKPRAAKTGAPSAPVKYSQAFSAKMGRAIADGIDTITKKTIALVDFGFIPILLGPTGCGKTSAVRKVAQHYGCALEETGGTPSAGDADVVGLKMAAGDIDGLIARAFKRAQAGEKVLIFVDEFLRFELRVQNIFMRALLEIENVDALAMGIPADGKIYVVDAPVYGQIWAPADKIIWVFGSNPWGADVDPAFGRRVQPCYVTYNEAALAEVDAQMADAIRETWRMANDGQLSLPFEYGMLAKMKNGKDISLVPFYLDKLRFLNDGSHQMVESLFPTA